MEDVLVGSLMSSPVVTVSPDVTVQVAAQRMTEQEISSVVVVDDENEIEGILTSTDYVHIAANGVDATTTPVAEYMSTDVVATSVNTPVHDVAERMMQHGVHHMPATDDVEGVIGMITTKDFAAYLSEARAPTPFRSAEIIVD